MTIVKICGITNSSDALVAKDAGADLLGIIQVPDTPRYVREESSVRSIVEAVEEMPVVGVFASLADAESCPWKFQFQYFQVYEMDVDAIPTVPTIYCLRVRALEEALSVRVPVHAEYLLLDAYHPDKLGGAGTSFNWSIFKAVQNHFQRSTFLAGGLNPENIGEAVFQAKPFGVDVSSGIEASPGNKDHTKLREFVSSVRSVEGNFADSLSA